MTIIGLIDLNVNVWEFVCFCHHNFIVLLVTVVFFLFVVHFQHSRMELFEMLILICSQETYCGSVASQHAINGYYNRIRFIQNELNWYKISIKLHNVKQFYCTNDNIIWHIGSKSSTLKIVYEGEIIFEFLFFFINS